MHRKVRIYTNLYKYHPLNEYHWVKSHRIGVPWYRVYLSCWVTRNLCIPYVAWQLYIPLAHGICVFRGSYGTCMCRGPKSIYRQLRCIFSWCNLKWRKYSFIFSQQRFFKNGGCLSLVWVDLIKLLYYVVIVSCHRRGRVSRAGCPSRQQGRGFDVVNPCLIAWQRSWCGTRLSTHMAKIIGSTSFKHQCH